ncbi:MAG TPA: universal stress protein [Solirubrobacteraceae bacterium]|nr:universal stress protein [Solirubrobacteraceae bacterium]
MFQRLLIAWDGSDAALRAFDVAIDVARRYDAELVAVSVAYSPAHAETSGDREESAAAAHRYLRETFAEVADRALRAGVDVEHQIIEGRDPSRALLEHAHEHGFDMIVMGHHRSRSAGRLLLRGVARELLAGATIPLLVVSEQTQ